MDLDHRFQPSGGASGGRIILLGDGTEIEAGSDGAMFDQVDEDKDLAEQVDKFGNTKTSAEVTESPSSVATEKSEGDATKEADKPASSK
jgi:protein phosphatase 2C family protein 2/3